MAVSKDKPTNLDRQVEEAFATALGYIFKPFLHGCKQLKNRKLLIMFFISIALGILGKLFLKQLHPAFRFSILLPVLFIWVLGVFFQTKRDKYKSVWESIQFRGKDEKVPTLVSEKRINKKVVELSFKSVIPFKEWEQNLNYIETALDTTIVRLTPDRSKQICHINCMAPGYDFPVNIPWKDEYMNYDNGIIVMGEDPLGQFKIDLNSTPHVLVAGETGSGKSVILKCFAWQLILKGAKPYFIDFKGGVEFGPFKKYGQVVSNEKEADELLTQLVEENAKRLALFERKGVENLDAYNNQFPNKLCRIFVITDEAAQLLDKTGRTKEDKEILSGIEGKMSTLARLSRAPGINLILGVQRPDANTIPGQIKNNIPARISGRFADRGPSDIVLGNNKAADLPNIKGRFVFKIGPDTMMFQAYNFGHEIVKNAKLIKVKGRMLIEKRKAAQTESPKTKKTET